MTDAEVLQEILHRYTAINRRDDIGPALQVIPDIVDDEFAVEKLDVLRVGEVTQKPSMPSARAAVRVAVHVAVMERHAIGSILSFDADFDRGRD